MYTSQMSNKVWPHRSVSSALSEFGASLCRSLAVFVLVVSGVSAATPSLSTNLVAEDPEAQISVTVWLNLHNKATLDSMVDQMYDKTSPNYHQFLTPKQFTAQFAPTAKEAAQVGAFLAAHNLKVTSTGKNNHFVVARGRIADAQRAFSVNINRAMVNGQARRVASAAASIADPTTKALVSTVTGLSGLAYRANVIRASNPETKTPYPGISPLAAGSDGVFFSSTCLFPPQTQTFTTAGGLPKATYTGNRYGSDIDSLPPNLAPCGYSAGDLQQAYGLKPLYKAGLNGAGQTIVIVDAFGSNTIVKDVNTYSTINGLPHLITSGPSANFFVYTPTGPATCTADNGCIAGDWQYETTVDVESAHAIAPGANIVLVEAADNSFSNLDLANLFAIENLFGNVVSNSFGISEAALVEYDPTELIVENTLAELAAALGISLDVSSGDSGDDLAEDTADFGMPTVSVDSNANSPYATGVGRHEYILGFQRQHRAANRLGLERYAHCRTNDQCTHRSTFVLRLPRRRRWRDERSFPQAQIPEKGYHCRHYSSVRLQTSPWTLIRTPASKWSSRPQAFPATINLLEPLAALVSHVPCSRPFGLSLSKPRKR